MRNIDTIKLPQDVADLLQQDDALTVDQLTKIGEALVEKRNKAIAHRVNSGIEETWIYCEEAYAGVDDANRGEFLANRWIKPTHMSSPVTTGSVDKRGGEKRSTAFVRITSRYVDAGTAKIGEILLSDKAFNFSPTPVPTLIHGLDDKSPIIERGVPLMRAPQPHELPAQQTPAQPGAPPPPDVPVTTHDVAEEAIEKAKRAAKKAEERMYDQMVECGHTREMHKVLFDACRLGVGVLKGPFPDVRRRRAVRKGENGELIVEIKEEIVPADKWVDPWNIFPDPACGEDIRNGDMFERDFFSEKQVLDLIGRKGYVTSQLRAVLEKGPNTVAAQGKNPVEPIVEHPYIVWFYYGAMKKSDFSAINAKASGTIPVEKDIVNVFVTIINDIVVHGTLHHLASGDTIYYNVPWLRRPGSWAGVGVAEQLVVPQRIVNGATRAMINNAGISSGPQIVMDEAGIRPANKEWEITPNKLWYKSNDSMTDDVQKAFYSFDITNVEGPMRNIIEYGLRVAEESTNIPLITQGLSGRTTPETLGATQLQDNNANQLLRNIGYRFDDYLTVPLVNAWYEYNLMDPNIPDDEKGDFSIHAHGSIALVEKAIRSQFIAQMTPIATPQYGVDPKKWFQVVAKSNHLDPTEVQFTKEEQARLDQTPPPPVPAVEVAKIKAQVSAQQMQLDQQRAQEEDALARELAQLDAQSAQEIEKIRNTTAQLRAKLDVDRDRVYVEAETERVRTEFVGKMKEIENKRQLAQEEFALKHKLNLDQIKQKLADASMKIIAQKELALLDAKLTAYQHGTPSAKDLIKPPVQIKGKAGNGKAFSQV